MNLRALALTAFAGVMLAGCAADGGLHQSTIGGTLSLKVQAADDSTGAMVIRISGGPVDSIVATDGGVMVASATDATGASVFLDGTLPGGTEVARVYVPDARVITGYSVSIEEAANRVTAAQRDLGSNVVRTTAAPVSAP